ncbi:hypothetical protein FJW05_26210 [Mesorhizobium sp. B2-9-1]|nr:hypothetical protein FJW05_26210 [Mesorhizobium sp. B2-9-1]TPJ28165.1 hypothetical protein FJ425_13895 [Mesorhizobium sp. B2-7-2]
MGLQQFNVVHDFGHDVRHWTFLLI